MKNTSVIGFLGVNAVDARTTTGVQIRRMLRNSEICAKSNGLEKAYSSSKNRSDIYKQGIVEGQKVSCVDLSDVLYSANRNGLGFVSIIQESNSHILFRVQQCRECTKHAPGAGCDYTAGFLCGALMAMGKPMTVNVHEVSCGEVNSCVFMASW